MERILARVSSAIDKREGSIIWDATGPASVELATLYTALDFILTATYADTAPREYLIKRAAERGLAPKAAAYAVLHADFNKVVPIGSRFSCDKLNYIVTERMEDADTENTVAFRVQCETVGAIGNTEFGRLIPIEYINGLDYAELVEVLIPGAEEEDTETFRKRYIDSLTSQAFGGNQTDYKDKVLSLAGVGAVKVIPVWNGDIKPSDMIPSSDVTAWYTGVVDSLTGDVKTWLTAVYTAVVNEKLTVGGTVRLVIMDSAYGIPSAELVADVQEAIDPPGSQGDGLGIAPIGHVVSVVGVASTSVDVAFTLEYKPGWDFDAAKSYIESAIDDYFAELAKEWQDDDGGLVVRIAQLETRVLSSPGILDVKSTLINGQSENLTLDVEHIPVRGDVSG
jgi:uncharacterized phage protein gp47/JayE